MREMFLIGLASSLIACAVDSGDIGSTSQSIVQNNRLAGNRLAGNRLAGNRLAGNRLAGNRLAGNRLEFDSSADDLLSTADGREVLTYVIGCAVPEGTTLVGKDPTTGTEYEFFGEIGIAPKWVDHQLDRDGERWVSACLFARVNAFDVAVPVSLRGPNNALATTDDEKASWTLQEGAFFGNWFSPTTGAIDWNACRGHDNTDAEDRDCTAADPANPGKTICGFNDAGTCYGTGHNHATNHDGACRAFSSHGYYVDCSFRSESHGHDHGQSHAGGNAHHDFGGWGHDHHDDDDDDHGDDGGMFSEVITTYVHP